MKNKLKNRFKNRLKMQFVIATSCHKLWFMVPQQYEDHAGAISNMDNIYITDNAI